MGQAFKLCPPTCLKVVIVGQDPYPQKGYATGLAFANPINTKIISPSLSLLKERVYNDFYTDRPNEFNFDITLESWAKQGILLLNSALTVEENKPESHSRLWYPAMSALLHDISKKENLIFILLGSTAATFKNFIISKNNHIFAYKHPAYFARISHEFICDGFIKTNEILSERKQQIINF